MHFCEIRGNIEIVVGDGGNLVYNTQMRKAMYRIFTYIKFFHLGRGVRIQVPYCVADKIRGVYPSRDGQYMGFKDTLKNEIEE